MTSTPSWPRARSVLYCIVLYCTVLYCTVLYCTVRTVLQASFWRSRGYEFSALSVAECQQLEPALAPATARHGLLDNEVNTEGV